MKNLLIFMVSVTAFSNVFAMTCMSSKKSQQMIKADISMNQASLSYEGEEYSRLFLMNVKGNVRTYKQIGELANMITVRSDASGVQAKLYQVSKGGTRLVMNMELCK